MWLLPCALQLGGIAGLQAACPDDLHPDLNNVDDLRANLANAKALTGQLATTPTSSPLSNALAARVSLLRETLDGKATRKALMAKQPAMSLCTLHSAPQAPKQRSTRC